MKILLLSRDGDGLGLAHQLKKEGNSVKAFCVASRDAGLGLVDRVDSWRPHISWADLVISDGPGWGVYENLLKQMGKPLLGISDLSDVLSFDRAKSRVLLSKTGMDLPRQWTLVGGQESSFADVLRGWTEPGVVLRVDGVHVCRDVESFLYAVKKVPEGQNAVVEDLVEGVEVRTAGWFNGRGWLEPFYHGFMDMEEAVGKMGRVGQSMGGVVVRSGGDSLVERMLMPLTKALQMMGYRGSVTITGFVNQQELFVVGIKLGMCFDELDAVLGGSRGSVGDLLFETAQGVGREIDVTRDKMAVIRVNSLVEDGGAPVVGLNEGNMKHLWLNGVRVSEDGSVTKADGTLPVFKATSIGRDVREAIKRAHRTVERVSFMHKYYRADACQRAMADVGQLKAWELISD